MPARLTDVPDRYDPQAWRQIIRDLGARFAKLEKSVGVYTVSNYTPTRTLDMGTATAADIGDFVATLVADLQDAKRLGGE